METEKDVEGKEAENLSIDAVAEAQIDSQTENQLQDLKETIEKDLLATEEAIVDQLQGLNEMIVEAHIVKKAVIPLSSKRNLSKNLQRNLLFNLNKFCH